MGGFPRAYAPYRPCQYHPDSRFAYLGVIFGMEQGVDVVLRMVNGGSMDVAVLGGKWGAWCRSRGGIFLSGEIFGEEKKKGQR